MTELSVEELIKKLQLEPLPPEGGMHRQTYVSTLSIGGVPAGTAIYYLLSGEDFSHLHRLPRGEMYHFYLGDPVELTELLPDGTFRRTVLGQDLGAGQEVQHMVEPGTWQGSRLAPGGRFALMGTTMCPGFTPDCYEQGDRETLLAAYPGAAEEIMQLTKERRP